MGERQKGSKENAKEAWIQVDLGKTFDVTTIQTQGRNGINQWINKFTLEYGIHENVLTAYKERNGNPKVSVVLPTPFYIWYFGKLNEIIFLVQ